MVFFCVLYKKLLLNPGYENNCSLIEVFSFLHLDLWSSSNKFLLWYIVGVEIHLVHIDMLFPYNLLEFPMELSWSFFLKSVDHFVWVYLWTLICSIYLFVHTIVNFIIN